MDDAPVKILFELIRFDMQQIQNYREAIFEISVTIIAASFGISAFIYRKDNTLSHKVKSWTLIGTNIALLLVLSGFTYSYQYQGLKFTRSALELRQIALTEHLFHEKPLTTESLYPLRGTIEAKDPDIKSFLERIPLYIALLIIVIKTISEVVILRMLHLREAQQENSVNTITISTVDL